MSHTGNRNWLIDSTSLSYTDCRIQARPPAPASGREPRAREPQGSLTRSPGCLRFEATGPSCPSGERTLQSMIRDTGTGWHLAQVVRDAGLGAARVFRFASRNRAQLDVIGIGGREGPPRKEGGQRWLARLGHDPGLSQWRGRLDRASPASARHRTSE